MTNPFAIFDLPVTFNIDLGLLSNRYLELQKSLHPDNFVTADSATQRQAMQKALEINDALKVMLLKYSSLENVKNVAENELSMVYPNKDNTIMIDMSKDYFSHINEEENGESFLDKIKSIFN